MKLKVNEKVIYIEESVIIVLFVCLLSKIAREYLANYYLCFLFIVFHELSHITVALFFGSSVKKINIKLCGLSVNLEKKFKGRKAILVYLAGPIANIILAILFKNIKIVFEINICLALINLIPIKPLDGYNILREIFSKKFLKFVANISEIILTFLGIILIFKYCNISLIMLLLYIKLTTLNSAK